MTDGNMFTSQYGVERMFDPFFSPVGFISRNAPPKFKPITPSTEEGKLREFLGLFGNAPPPSQRSSSPNFDYLYYNVETIQRGRTLLTQRYRPSTFTKSFLLDRPTILQPIWDEYQRLRRGGIPISTDEGVEIRQVSSIINLLVSLDIQGGAHEGSWPFNKNFNLAQFNTFEEFLRSFNESFDLALNNGISYGGNISFNHFDANFNLIDSEGGFGQIKNLSTLQANLSKIAGRQVYSFLQSDGNCFLKCLSILNSLFSFANSEMFFDYQNLISQLNIIPDQGVSPGRAIRICADYGINLKLYRYNGIINDSTLYLFENHLIQEGRPYAVMYYIGNDNIGYHYSVPIIQPLLRPIEVSKFTFEDMKHSSTLKFTGKNFLKKLENKNSWYLLSSSRIEEEKKRLSTDLIKLNVFIRRLNGQSDIIKTLISKYSIPNSDIDEYLKSSTGFDIFRSIPDKYRMTFFDCETTKCSRIGRSDVYSVGFSFYHYVNGEPRINYIAIIETSRNQDEFTYFIKRDFDFKKGNKIEDMVDITASLKNGSLFEYTIPYRNVLGVLLGWISKHRRTLLHHCYFLCGYNSAKFDNPLLISEMVALGLDIEKINPHLHSGKIINANVFNLELRDILRFTAGGTLKELLSAYNCEIQKGEMDHSLNQRYYQMTEENKLNCELYQRNDVIGLMEVSGMMGDMFDNVVINLPGSSWIRCLGAPGLAFRSMCQRDTLFKKLIGEGDIPLLDPHKDAFARQAFHGGRVTVRRRICESNLPILKDYPDSIPVEKISDHDLSEGECRIDLDVNSLYPFCMYQFDFPHGDVIPTDKFVEDKLGIYKIVYYPNIQNLNPVTRNKDDGWAYRQRMEGIYSSVTILDMIKHGDKVEVLFGFYFTKKSKYLREFISHHNAMKTKYTLLANEIEEKIGFIIDPKEKEIKTNKFKYYKALRGLEKLNMNSSFGKMGERLYRDKIKYSDINDSLRMSSFFGHSEEITSFGDTVMLKVHNYDEVESEDIKVPSYIAVFILAYSKVHMNEYMLRLSPNMIYHSPNMTEEERIRQVYDYTDTDSIKIRYSQFLECQKKYPEMFGEELGQLKDELGGGFIACGYYIEPKMYCEIAYKKVGDKYKKKISYKGKGISKNCLSLKVYQDLVHTLTSPRLRAEGITIPAGSIFRSVTKVTSVDRSRGINMFDVLITDVEKNIKINDDKFEYFEYGSKPIIIG